MFPKIPYMNMYIPSDIGLYRNAGYDRWDDAIACYSQEKYLAATYLAGYSIECLLKYVLLKNRFYGQPKINLKEEIYIRY